MRFPKCRHRSSKSLVTKGSPSSFRVNLSGFETAYKPDIQPRPPLLTSRATAGSIKLWIESKYNRIADDKRAHVVSEAVQKGNDRAIDQLCPICHHLMDHRRLRSGARTCQFLQSRIPNSSICLYKTRGSGPEYSLYDSRMNIQNLVHSTLLEQHITSSFTVVLSPPHSAPSDVPLRAMDHSLVETSRSNPCFMHQNELHHFP